MDYIFDWARDVYRKNTMDQILALAANTTTTLAADTDLQSVVGKQYHDVSLDFHEDLKHGPAPPEGYEISQLLRIFDVDRPTRACIRDARFMVHEVVGIDITQESFKTYLRFLSKDASQEQEYARKLQRSLRQDHAWHVSAATLDAIEYLWTGKDREHQDYRSPDNQFIVNFAITSRIERTESSGERRTEHEACWQQLHTLTFIAVSVDVVALVNEKAAFCAGKPSTQSRHQVNHNVALPLFKKIRNASVRQCLTSAMTSAQIITSHDRDELFWDHVRYAWNDMTNQTNPCFKDTPAGYTSIELPQAAYNCLKIGRAEPETSFLRISSLWHEQNVGGEAGSGWPHQKKCIDKRERVVFAYAVKEAKRKPVAREYSHCIFLVDPIGLHSSLLAVAAADCVILGKCPAPNVWRIRKETQLQQSVKAKGKARLTSPETHSSEQDQDHPQLWDLTTRDFDWFVERLDTEWSQINWLMRRSEDGYDIAELESFAQRIQTIRVEDDGDHLSVRLVIAIGISYGLRPIIKHLRALTSKDDPSEHCKYSQVKSATCQTMTETTNTVPSRLPLQRSSMAIPDILPLEGRSGKMDFESQTPAKRVIVIEDDEDDEDDGQPGPSKRLRQDKPPSDEGEVEGSSPSMRSYITVEDEDEDRIVRLSLSGVR